MSQNLYQIYLANPITTNASTDIMYFGQSPYGVGNDAGMTYSNFSAQFNQVVNQTTSSVTMVSNTFYLSNAGASLVTFTLPVTSAMGDYIEISGFGIGGWRIAQAAGQSVIMSPFGTTLGVGGSITSTGQFDTIRLRCIIANTEWVTMSQQSTGLTIV